MKVSVDTTKKIIQMGEGEFWITFEEAGLIPSNEDLSGIEDDVTDLLEDREIDNYEVIVDQYKLNPKAKEISMTYVFDLQELLDMGWDFDIDNPDIVSDYCAILKITNENGKIWTGVELNKWKDQVNKISNGIMEHTGDDNATIQDVCDYISKNPKFFTDGNLKDYSTDENNNYISTFIIS